MHYNFLVGRLACIKEEKQPVFEMVRKLVRLGQDVRREGLLFLEEAAEQEKDSFLRSCLRYIVEEAPGAEEFREYASIWMLAASESGARLLEMAVIADGLEQILRQQAPASLLRRLGAWLGTDFAAEVEMDLAAMERELAEKQWTERMSRETSLAADFDTLCGLSNGQLESLLEQADERVLALSLMGASGAVISRVQEIASPQLWERLEQAMALLQYPRACDVRSAQRELLKIQG